MIFHCDIVIQTNEFIKLSTQSTGQFSAAAATMAIMAPPTAPRRQPTFRLRPAVQPAATFTSSAQPAAALGHCCLQTPPPRLPCCCTAPHAQYCCHSHTHSCSCPHDVDAAPAQQPLHCSHMLPSRRYWVLRCCCCCPPPGPHHIHNCSHQPTPYCTTPRQTVERHDQWPHVVLLPPQKPTYAHHKLPHPGNWG